MGWSTVQWAISGDQATGIKNQINIPEYYKLCKSPSLKVRKMLFTSKCGSISQKCIQNQAQQKKHTPSKSVFVLYLSFGFIPVVCWGVGLVCGWVGLYQIKSN